jgi:fatty acid desaturase
VAWMMGWVYYVVPLVFATRWQKMQHILGRVIVFVLQAVWCYVKFCDGTWAGLFKAHMFAWIPGMMFSAIFVVNANINHVNADNEHEKHKKDTDFFVHQVNTSSSHSTDSYFSFLMSGGLNLQIEHHLLPGVNHCHIFNLSPKIRALCEKHKLDYTKFDTFDDAVRAHLDFSYNLSNEEYGAIDKSKSKLQ